MDEHTRKCVVLKVAFSITSEDLIDTFVDLLATLGVPGDLCSDNAKNSWLISGERGWRRIGTRRLFQRQPAA